MLKRFVFAREERPEAAWLARFIAGIHPEDSARVQAAIASAIADGEPYRIEYRVVGGATEHVVSVVGKLSDIPEDGRRLAGVIIDITEQRRAEQALQKLNNSLEQRVAEEVAERAKAEEALRQAQKMEAVGQLTGGVAHDFNNLLTIIIGGLDTIRRCRPGDEARMKRALDTALQGAQRAASLTGRLLAFSRRQPLAPKPLELNGLVRDMTDLLHRTIGEQIYEIAQTQVAEQGLALAERASRSTGATTASAGAWSDRSTISTRSGATARDRARSTWWSTSRG